MSVVSAALVVVPAGVILAQTQGERVGQAREAAQADRNEEAVELFELALEAEPGLRDEILREYADQLTFITRAAEAAQLFKEVLAS